MLYRTSWILLVALVLSGCKTDAESAPPFRHQDLYSHLQQCAEDFTLIDGDWKEDFGDAAFYGPAFYVQAGKTEGNQSWLDLAAVAHERNMRLIRDEDLMTGDTNEILMASMGMIEYMSATGDLEHLAQLNAVMENVEELLAALEWYLPPELMSGYAMETYGPTSINGLVGLVFLQHALLLGGETKDRFVECGRRMAEQIREYHWNQTFYEFSADRPGLFLYPNLCMIILHTRLYQLTDDQALLDRALDAYQAIQPLKVETESGLVGPGRYFSPYSAEYMGAETDNYTTLSSQNYLVFALSLLYQATGEASFIEEIDPVLDFLAEYLDGNWCLADVHKDECDPACEDGDVCLDGDCTPDACQVGILHHWMDGRLAEPHDPEFFCSGCNLQLLYSIFFIY